MALPKEPRQKMINMMYLVLTALLALNVSSEILNAFKIVDKSLKSSNTNLNASSEAVMKSFKDKLSDPTTAKDAQVWYPLAEKSTALSKEIDKLVQEYKGKLIMESGGATATDSAFKEDNLDAGTRLFEKEGEKLFAALNAYRTNLLNVHPEIKAKFEKSLPLQFDQSNAKDWTVKNFHMVPTVAALTILSKLQNDVKNSENQVVNHFHSKIGAVIIKYDKFAALVGQSSNYIMPGEKITITAGVGAFSNAATPQVSVGGSNIAVGPDGTATVEVDGGGGGTQSRNVVVRFKDQDGNPQVLEKEIKWTVGTPGGAAVMLDKMNVFYVGVDNPVTISSGTGWDKTSVSMSGGSLSGSNGKYTVRVSAEGTASIVVKTDKGSSNFSFRIKSLPPATAMIGKNTGDPMPAASFRAMGGLRAELLNSEFDAPYTVVSYNLTGSGAGFPTAAYAANEGGFWAGQAAAIANKAVPGSVMSFSNIIIKGPDGKPRKAANPSIVIRCQ